MDSQINQIPLVSICCVTYNHEKYIRQCLEGFVMQKTNFAFEILVHEDASTDSTAQIVREFEIKYPHLFRCIYQTENQFLKQNVLTNILIPTARGNYISMCEGDDYWTDSNKLQIQIDFLEKNKGFVGCFHNTEERFEEDHSKSSFLYCNFNSSRAIDFQSLTYQNLIPTCSVVFRKNLFGKIPDWHSKLKMGDWPIHLLNAQYGDYWYIPWVMAVHRLHSKSTWMLQDVIQNNQFVVEAYDIMIENFNNNKIFHDYLVRGKEAFAISNNIEQEKRSYKKKIKNFLLKVIERL